MPRCPKCHRSFRVMEDEDDGQHMCPKCGYDGHEETLYCLWCDDPIRPDEPKTYCSQECAINAEIDSAGDIFED